jgi:hypothetical protein
VRFCKRDNWLVVTPIPSFPLNGEGELRVYMRQETIDTKIQARLVSLRELQSATGEELDALLPSVLDKAFRGEL